MVVFNRDVPILSGFSGKGKHHIVPTFGIIAFDVLYVHGFQGGQSVGFVGASVFVGTHSNVVQVHQADHKGRHGVKAHVPSIDVSGHLATQAR